MASVGSVTRQIAAMEITNKKPTPGSSSIRPPAAKPPAQPNVTKLLTKFAAPNPFTNASNKPANPSSLRNPTPNHTNAQPSTSSKPGHGSQSSIDIGKYDGGLEIDNEKRGERIYGEAAEELALDSSVSRCDTYLDTTNYVLKMLLGNTLPANGPCTTLTWAVL